MHCAISEISQLLRMAHHESYATPGVSGVRAGSGVSGRESRAHGGIADCPSPRAVAHRLERAVPSGGRHPYLDLDIRVGRRLQRSGDAAERGKILICVSTATPAVSLRRSELARSHRLRQSDRSVLQCERLRDFRRLRLPSGMEGDSRDRRRKPIVCPTAHPARIVRITSPCRRSSRLRRYFRFPCRRRPADTGTADECASPRHWSCATR